MDIVPPTLIIISWEQIIGAFLLGRLQIQRTESNEGDVFWYNSTTTHLSLFESEKISLTRGTWVLCFNPSPPCLVFDNLQKVQNLLAWSSFLKNQKVMKNATIFFIHKKWPSKAKLGSQMWHSQCFLSPGYILKCLLWKYKKDIFLIF